MTEVGWFDDRAFDEHLAGGGHPERPERLFAVREALARSGADSKLVQRTPNEVDRGLLEEIHDAGYVASVEES